MTHYHPDETQSAVVHLTPTLIETFVATVSVMPFDDECATAFGKVAARLIEKGQPIGSYDALIAAHAIALGVTPVTNNEKHFGQIDGLRLANWV